jgi:hypothetical protein
MSLRHKGFPYRGRRRVKVRYETDSTPASASTRNASNLDVGSMIRASTNARNT